MLVLILILRQTQIREYIVSYSIYSILCHLHITVFETQHLQHNQVHLQLINKVF